MCIHSCTLKLCWHNNNIPARPSKRRSLIEVAERRFSFLMPQRNLFSPSSKLHLARARIRFQRSLQQIKSVAMAVAKRHSCSGKEHSSITLSLHCNPTCYDHWKWIRAPVQLSLAGQPLLTSAVGENSLLRDFKQPIILFFYFHQWSSFKRPSW